MKQLFGVVNLNIKESFFGTFVGKPSHPRE
jgi:hypothetical protein